MFGICFKIIPLKNAYCKKKKNAYCVFNCINVYGVGAEQMKQDQQNVAND